MSHACPACGEDGFSRESDMKVHHAKVHGESLAGFETTCDQCGDTFRADSNNARFCSQDCYGDYVSEHQAGENHPNWCGGDIEVECVWCGNLFEVNPARSDARYCSKECDNAARSERYVGEQNPNWNGGHVELICDWCAGPFKAKRSRMGYRRFCSLDCRSEWRSVNLTGEDHWNYTGGKIHDYGENWHRKRRKRLELDDHVCQVCKRPEDDISESLHVHHIQPIRTFDAPEDANTMSNLITLCRPCHIRWEGIPLRPENSP